MTDLLDGEHAPSQQQLVAAANAIVNAIDLDTSAVTKALVALWEAAAKAERERIAGDYDRRASELGARVGEWTDVGARNEVTIIARTLRNNAAALRGIKIANLREPDRDLPG